jgi:hypothetical protein
LCLQDANSINLIDHQEGKEKELLSLQYQLPDLELKRLCHLVRPDYPVKQKAESPESRAMIKPFPLFLPGFSISRPYLA